MILFLNGIYRIERIGIHDALFGFRKHYEGKTVKLLKVDVPNRTHIKNYGKKFKGFIGCDVVTTQDNESIPFYQVKLRKVN